jgi:hypothetical protein
VERLRLPFVNEVEPRLVWALLGLGAAIALMGVALDRSEVAAFGLITAVVAVVLGVLRGRLKSFHIGLFKGEFRGELVEPDDVVREYRASLETVDLRPRRNARRLRVRRRRRTTYSMVATYRSK